MQKFNYIFMLIKVMPETLSVPFFFGHGVDITHKALFTKDGNANTTKEINIYI